MLTEGKKRRGAWRCTMSSLQSISVCLFGFMRVCMEVRMKHRVVLSECVLHFSCLCSLPNSFFVVNRDFVFQNLDFLCMFAGH